MRLLLVNSLILAAAVVVLRLKITSDPLIMEAPHTITVVTISKPIMVEDDTNFMLVT